MKFKINQLAHITQMTKKLSKMGKKKNALHHCIAPERNKTRDYCSIIVIHAEGRPANQFFWRQTCFFGRDQQLIPFIGRIHYGNRNDSLSW